MVLHCGLVLRHYVDVPAEQAENAHSQRERDCHAGYVREGCAQVLVRLLLWCGEQVAQDSCAATATDNAVGVKREHDTTVPQCHVCICKNAKAPQQSLKVALK